MPVNGLRSRTHESVPEHSASMGLGHLNTTSFLFDEEEKAKDSATSPDVKSYLQMTDDKFPILVRRNEYPGVVSPPVPAVVRDRLTVRRSFLRLQLLWTWRFLSRPVQRLRRMVGRLFHVSLSRAFHRACSKM